MSNTHTKISWCTATWNPVVGCERVSAGCDNCWAKTLHDMRHKASLEGKMIAPQYREPFETVQLKPERLRDPLSWRKSQRVFVNSVSDLFHRSVPDDFRDQVFAIMVRAHWHVFQILTKRPERMRAYMTAPDRVEAINRVVAQMEGWTFKDGQQTFAWPRANIHLGVSVENQETADKRIPILLQTPAAVRWLSCEPLLGALDLSKCLLALRLEGHCATRGVHWVVAGGESGKNARPMHPDWARSLRQQCKAAGVAFHFKQWGEYREFDVGPEPEVTLTGTVTADTYAERAEKPAWLDMSGNLFTDPDDLPVETPCRLLERVGTKRAGRVLDGRKWDEFPAVAS